MIVLRPDLATPEFMADEPNVTPPSPDFLMRQLYNLCLII
jgi:hypothetical protein